MKDILNPWVIVGSVITASLLLIGVFLAAGSIIPAHQLSEYGEAALTVLPVPTYTSTAVPSTPALTPTAETISGIQIGSYVKIVGTEGEGLRLRKDPTLNGEIIYLGVEDEVFLVSNGPEDQDGYLWWFLEAPVNETRNGWAVSNYLQVEQNP